MHLHSYTNIKVTKDLKIVGNIPEVSEEDLDRYNIVKLYHASHTGLRGSSAREIYALAPISIIAERYEFYHTQGWDYVIDDIISRPYNP